MNKGFTVIRFLFTIVIILIALSLLGVNIQSDIVQNPEVQNNTSFVMQQFQTFWNTTLAGPLTYFWNNIIINIFWNSFIENMTTLSEGGGITWDTSMVMPDFVGFEEYE